MLGTVVAILSTVVIVDTVLVAVIIHGFLSNESKYREVLRRKHTLLDEVEMPYEDIPSHLAKAKSKVRKPALKLQFGRGKTLVPNK